MTVQVSYPGVYIQEIPSGVRSIASVATSITAFVGRARLGPVGQPITCFSFGDFQRNFGGLDPNRPLSYSVRDFFNNGGGQSVIVRLFEEDATDGVASLTVGGNLDLVAANPGAWGDALEATVSTADDQTAVQVVAERYGLNAADMFDLSLVDTTRDLTETFANVSVVDTAGARRVDRLLNASSNLMRAGPGGLPGARPADEAGVSATDGDDGLTVAVPTYQGNQEQQTGIFALEKTDLFNLMVLPPDTRAGDTAPAVLTAAANYCQERRAMLVVDPPAAWAANSLTAIATARSGMRNTPPVTGSGASNAAIYFPRIEMRDPLRDNQLDTFPPSGAIAGIMAATDGARGVWKAPAGIDASLSGVNSLEIPISDPQNGQLNPIALNCLRTFPGIGTVVWGSRTMVGSDQRADDFKYIPVRRLTLFLEESLYRGTQWVVFEPNDEPLWSQIRLNVGAFMQRLFRQGAFQGSSPREAFFVKCDRETTTQDDIDRGIVNIAVGFAPLKPAEFVVISIQQIRNVA